MATSSVNVGGSWKELVDGTAVNVGGTWKNVAEIFVNVGGTWKSAWSNVVITLTGATNNATSTGSSSSASLRVYSDGDVYFRDNGGSFVQISGATDWVRPTAQVGNYEARFTNLTGDTGSFSANVSEDAWTDMATGFLLLTVTDTSDGPESKSVTFDVEIRDKATNTTQATAEYTLTANRDAS